jgi:hypothetical protein
MMPNPIHPRTHAGPPFVVVLDWRTARVGPLAPCVLCGTPAVCRSPGKHAPCHKQCAESWIATHARDHADLARLIGQATPARGRSS